MPKSGADDDDVEETYARIEELLKLIKRKDKVFVMGNWNAVVGEKKTIEK